MPHILACRNWRFWVNLGSATSLATTPSPTRSNSSSPSRPLLSGPPQFLLLLAMSRSGPPTAPLPGPGDFERFPGMGRGSALPGAGAYGQLANVGGIPSPGGRGASADLLTPIFLAAGAANYRSGMHGVPFGDPNFNPFLGGIGAVRGQIQGFGELGAQGLPAPPPPPPGGLATYPPNAAAAAASAAQVNAFAGLGNPAQAAVRGEGNGTMGGDPAAAALSMLAMMSPAHQAGARGNGMSVPQGVAAAQPAIANPALTAHGPLVMVSF